MTLQHSKYEHQLGELRRIILDGVSCFIVWQGLNKEYEESSRNVGLHTGFWWKYRGFFAPARNALLFRASIQLSKAFDVDIRTVSISNILKIALENRQELAPYATRSSLNALLNKINDNNELIQRLRRYRNQRLAHFDSDLNGNIELSSEEVNTLIEETKLIYNSIKYSYEGKFDDFNEIMENVYLHSKQVIDIMIERQDV